MNYIVLDLEWNQCPSGKSGEVKALPFEIIEIGAVRLDASHEITDRFHEVVRPQVYTTLHYKTREIVSLRSIDFAGARTFPEVAEDFFAWCRNSADPPVYCSWGPADLTELQRNLAYHQMNSPFPFPLLYYDLQKIFSIVYEDRKSRRSLEYAVDFLNLPKEIPFHSALSDANYASLVMQTFTEEQIQGNSSVDYFRTPKSRKQEIYLHYSTYDKFVSKPFSSGNQAMKDPVVTSMYCPSCGKKAQKKVRWFSNGGHNQLCAAWCQNCGYLKGKIRLRRQTDGTTYAVKTIRLISDEEARQIREKRDRAHARKKSKKDSHAEKNCSP